MLYLVYARGNSTRRNHRFVGEPWKSKMKQFQFDAWIDDRPVVGAMTIKAGSFKTAFNKAAHLVKQRARKGARVKKMSIRMYFVCGIKKDTILPTTGQDLNIIGTVEPRD